MNTKDLAETATGKVFVKALAAGMESRFRYRFYGPSKILAGVTGLLDGSVLEVGCGTGFFTIPAAKMIGPHGHYVAMDILPGSVELVAKKVQAARLQNVRVIEGDALKTNLDSESFNIVILFGVIPAPMLPLAPLLTEMHRILKPEGNLAIWPPIPGMLPHSIVKSGLFTLICKLNGVHNFRKC
jgi:ubiquinone/menaquinone biosynthesis C-methylase UbiE